MLRLMYIKPLSKSFSHVGHSSLTCMVNWFLCCCQCLRKDIFKQTMKLHFFINFYSQKCAFHIFSLFFLPFYRVKYISGIQILLLLTLLTNLEHTREGNLRYVNYQHKQRMPFSHHITSLLEKDNQNLAPQISICSDL